MKGENEMNKQIVKTILSGMAFMLIGGFALVLAASGDVKQAFISAAVATTLYGIVMWNYYKRMWVK